MTNDFGFYVQRGLVKKKIPNVFLAKSLLEKSKSRLQRVDEDSVRLMNFLILEDSYEAVREAAQSLMEIDGYKPYSHEALIAFLRSKNYDIDLNKLDRFRILRNESVYEAKEFSLETYKDALIFAKETVPKINKLFMQKLGEGIK